MEAKICVFEENEITFLLSKDNSMMVNATEMAKAFDAEVAHFMANDSTKKNYSILFKNSEFRVFRNKKK